MTASRKSAPKGAPQRQHGGFALGLVVGLLVGLAAALAVALYVTKTPVPLMNKAQQRTPEQDAAEAARNKNWDPNAALAGRPMPRPATPAAPSAPASDTAIVPRTNGPVLPPPPDNGRAPVVNASPAPQPSPGPAATAATPRAERPARDPAAILAGQANAGDGGAPVVDPFIYFVQVGAYSRPEDAEQQRARMALSGLRATVTDREQNGRTVHRVRLGPFDKSDDADAQLERAKAIDPEATLVRVERAKQ